ncbi:MAG TPA: hypothetical protein VMU21_12650 [Thermodesulfovibrionales bacterium]|nr:hypothetical protein [Thermodesulfovibrionales bacterium]
MKKGFYIGSLCGGILGVIVALSMDLVLGGALGSGWREAVAHDLGALTGKTFGINSVVVLAGVAIVVGIIGAFGALVGGIFGVMLARLFSFLTKGDEA